MGILRNYELSLWEDNIGSDGKLVENKIFVFGADSLETQSRAIEPKLKRNVNGTNELTFKMYSLYNDPITGEKVVNPFVSKLVNEAKIKLKFKNKWYDFIIKNVNDNSTNYQYSYTATDYHIQELSKNGFNLVLDASLENNIGSAEKLGKEILKDAGWDIEAETIPQTTDESLIEIVIRNNIVAVQLKDDESVAPTEIEGQIIPTGSTIYAFYSCCKNRTERFQFIYSEAEINKDSDRIIKNKNCQYYIDNVSYSITNDSKKYNLYCPTSILTATSFKISEKYRGRRYVFSQKTVYSKALQRYVSEFIDGDGNKVYHYTSTEYISPNIVQNYITNSTFETSTGWQGQYLICDEGYKQKKSTYGATVANKTDPDIYSAILSGETVNQYKTFLHLHFPSSIENKAIATVVNSSFYDNRKKFDGFSSGEKYVLFYKPLIQNGNLFEPSTSGGKFTVEIGEKILEAAWSGYNETKPGEIYLTFESTNASKASQDGYYYIISQVPSTYTLTKDQYASRKVQTFITIPDYSETDIYFEDFQIFKFFSPTGANADLILPIDSINTADAVTKYHYFNENELDKASEDLMTIDTSDQPRNDLTKSLTDGAEKINTLNISKSNYFNAIQSLCETFQCWADFQIEHEEDGCIKSKKIFLKNYIGKDNYAGFRYGVNLKGIQRKIDSKNIVSKLIVPNNTNKFANNGFCSISRAGANETGENYIYDFTYYINQGYLDQQQLTELLYDTTDAKGEDIKYFAREIWNEGDEENFLGYYTRLSILNSELETISNQLLTYSTPLMQAQADVTTYEAGRIAATEEWKNNSNSFRQSAGFEYTDIIVNGNEKETKARQDKVTKNITLNGYLTKITKAIIQIEEYTAKENSAKATLKEYTDAYTSLNNTYDRLIKIKQKLNLLFFKTYHRYIQEGTWNNNDCVDDEKYYIDAKSVAYTSSLPKVSYTIDVISLETIEGFSAFDFDLADKTWAEDVEYFGLDENGNPYRAEVVIAEITYALDEIDKDSIKVQNYKAQFEDLFRTITASVQNVQFSSGAWNNAADFTTAQPQEQSKFLQSALNYADTVLTNAGEQSVVWDKTGITVTDNALPSQQLRIVAGGIFLRDEDEDGIGWKAGITSSGINAKLITTGQLNTGAIQIMRGDEPYFRWDDHGITAYDFSESDTSRYINGLNTLRGVRFDRFGIYGYTNIDGSTWHPTSLDEIRNNSQFGLTWDGLFIKAGTATYNTGTSEATKIWHQSSAILGKCGDYIYNDWNSNGVPIYTADPTKPTFVKVFAAGTENSENLVIYDNGTITCDDIRLTGSIKWTSASSPSKSVYGRAELANTLPENGTLYNQFEEMDDPRNPRWHKIVDTVNDIYYAHTDDGGATWTGPYRLTGKSIQTTTIDYVIAAEGQEPSKLSGWSSTAPTDSAEAGQSLYIRMRDIYNDMTTSAYRYSVSGGKGANALNCYVESLSGNLFLETTTGNITLTARIFSGQEEIDKNGELTYKWYINEVYDETLSGKEINIDFAKIKNKSIYFEAE